MKALLLLAAVVLAGCATATAPANPPGTNANTLTEIQKSCDDPGQSVTFINGHSYFCGDYDTVQKSIQQLILQVHQRGA